MRVKGSRVKRTQVEIDFVIFIGRIKFEEDRQAALHEYRRTTEEMFPKMEDIGTAVTLFSNRSKIKGDRKLPPFDPVKSEHLSAKDAMARFLGNNNVLGYENHRRPADVAALE